MDPGSYRCIKESVAPRHFQEFASEPLSKTSRNIVPVLKMNVFPACGGMTNW
jgi:hypothetical protein